MGQAETIELPDTIEAIEYYYEQGHTAILQEPGHPLRSRRDNRQAVG